MSIQFAGPRVRDTTDPLGTWYLYDGHGWVIDREFTRRVGPPEIPPPVWLGVAMAEPETPAL